MLTYFDLLFHERTQEFKMGILEKIADIEAEISRTQKNKGKHPCRDTNIHFLFQTRYTAMEFV